MNEIRVIIADDHAVVRDGIAHTLKDMPNLTIVGEAWDGPTLFATLAREQPDCLLLDIVMPDFEPISAVQQIRARYPDLKILIVSAYDDDVYVYGLLSAGAHGYHLKNQPLSDLRLAVERVLAGERWVCSPLVEKLLRPYGTDRSVVTLTARQREILHYLQEGLDNSAIAHRTGLSVKTVENHLTHLYRQLNVQSRLEAVNYVSQHPGVLGPADPRPMPGEVISAAPPINILLVDDNLRYRTQLRLMIGRAIPPARVYEAENIQEALDLTKDIAPQLAFVDVLLGGENGIECARQIRECSPLTRVLLLSAYPDMAFHRTGLEAGAAALLSKKDLNVITLRQVIDDAI